MNKLETYNAIVKEVTDDMGLIKPAEPDYDNYLDAVRDEGKTANTIVLPTDITDLNTPLSVFADYELRDTVLCKALEDENFAFVLVNKVAQAVIAHEDNMTQDDMEALALVANVTCMYEQFNHTLKTLEAIGDSAHKFSLTIPPLAGLTVRLMENSASFPFESARKGTSLLLAELEAELNTNKDGE